MSARGWELLEAAAAGDRAAWAEFYARYRRRVGAVLAAAGIERDLVDDLVQETFLRAWSRLDRVRRDRESPMAWLNVIAANLARDHRKSATARRVRPLDHTHPGFEELAPPAADDPGTGALAAGERAADRCALAVLTCGLTERQRHAVAVFMAGGVTAPGMKTHRMAAYRRMRVVADRYGVHTLDQARECAW